MRPEDAAEVERVMKLSDEELKAELAAEGETMKSVAAKGHAAFERAMKIIRAGKMRPLLEFDDTGASDIELVKGVTAGDIRAWHDRIEELETLLQAFDDRTDALEKALREIMKIANDGWPLNKINDIARAALDKDAGQ
jgi:hypothetical protein